MDLRRVTIRESTAMIASYAAGFCLSAALIVAIGAQNVFVLRQGLRREHVAPVAMFCALADLLLVAGGVAGAGALLQAAPGAAVVLTLGGAVFLLCYGLHALRRAAKPGTLAATAGLGAASLAATMRAAAAFTLLNPHVYLDTVLLMGAAGSAEPVGTRAIFVAGAGTASAAWFAALGFGARLLAPLFAQPVAWRVLDALVAAIMLTLGGLLAAKAIGGLG
jgi:L-lysine exporter family protein LysE/ArgO